jgi:transglutaminase-like putative cysteine protease
MTALRWLRVQHDTVYEYDAAVELAHHVAYLAPRATEVQQVRGWTLSIDPLPDEWLALQEAHGEPVLPDDGLALPAAQRSLDSWGNQRLAFSHSRVHDRLTVRSTFEAGLSEPVMPDTARSPAWEEVAESLRYHAGAAHSEAVEFTLPSQFVPRSAQLAAFGRLAFTPGRSVLEGALALMALVHERFEYQPLATSVNTRATEALSLSRGVCQDFAHVMIGACRSLGLAARYVSGYLLTQPPPGSRGWWGGCVPCLGGRLVPGQWLAGPGPDQQRAGGAGPCHPGLGPGLCRCGAAARVIRGGGGPCRGWP